MQQEVKVVLISMNNNYDAMMVLGAGQGGIIFHFTANPLSSIEDTPPSLSA
jgi:hypothetical protein